MAGILFTVICLASDPARVRHVQTRLLPRIPGAAVMDAVERATLPPPEELQRQGIIHPVNDLLPHPLQRLGQVACALSHARLLARYAEDASDTWHVTVEDDVEVAEDFAAQVEARLTSLPPAAEACYLHVYDGKEDEVAAQEEVAPGVRRAHKMFATWAIAYRGRGAAKVLAHAFPMKRAIDNALSELVESRSIDMYTCFPPLARSAGDVGPFPEHRRAMRSTIWLTR